MTEVWTRAYGFEGHYEVSNLGRCRSAKATCGTRIGLILKPSCSRTGYLFVVLVNIEIRKTIRLHRLVYESFVGPILEGMQINHINGMKTDNRLENLEVVTASQNKLHAIHVLGHKPYVIPSQGEKNGRAKLKQSDIPEIFSLRERGWSQQKIADAFGINQTNISRILLGKSKFTIPIKIN